MFKKVIVSMGLLLTPVAYADGVCHLPTDCTFISSEFSTGGGKKATYVMEVDCKNPAGEVTKLMAWEVTASGLLGWGRSTIPKKVKFVMDLKVGSNMDCDF